MTAIASLLLLSSAQDQSSLIQHVPLPAKKKKTSENENLVNKSDSCLHVSRLTCVCIRHRATQAICAL